MPKSAPQPTSRTGFRCWSTKPVNPSMRSIQPKLRVTKATAKRNAITADAVRCPPDRRAIPPTLRSTRRRVFLRHALRHAEGPCVLYQVTQLVGADRGEVDVSPVVAHVGLT